MDKREFLAKNIANIITVLRIPIGLIMLIIGKLNTAFYILLLLGGLSDILDGFFARRLKIQSKLGSMLDSIADIAFFGSSLLVSIKVSMSTLSTTSILLLMVVLILRLFSYIISIIKFKSIASYHTYLNKATAVAIFVSIVAIPQTGINIPCIITCSIAIFAVIEEISIALISPILMHDIHSLTGAIKKIERRH